jgi:hypothetical protein
MGAMTRRWGRCRPLKAKGWKRDSTLMVRFGFSCLGLKGCGLSFAWDFDAVEILSRRKAIFRVVRARV